MSSSCPQFGAEVDIRPDVGYAQKCSCEVGSLFAAARFGSLKVGGGGRSSSEFLNSRWRTLFCKRQNFYQ